jgi:hypothetical protein
MSAKAGDKLWMVLPERFGVTRQEPVTITRLGRKYAYLNSINFRVRRDTGEVENGWGPREPGTVVGKVWASEEIYLYACRKLNTWKQIQNAFNSYRAVPPESYEDMLRIARDLKIEVKQ